MTETKKKLGEVLQLKDGEIKPRFAPAAELGQKKPTWGEYQETCKLHGFVATFEDYYNLYGDGGAA